MVAVLIRLQPFVGSTNSIGIAGRLKAPKCGVRLGWLGYHVVLAGWSTAQKDYGHVKNLGVWLDSSHSTLSRAEELGHNNSLSFLQLLRELILERSPRTLGVHGLA